MSLSDLLIDYQSEVASSGDYVHDQDEQNREFKEYVEQVMASKEFRDDMDAIYGGAK